MRSMGVPRKGIYTGLIIFLFLLTALYWRKSHSTLLPSLGDGKQSLLGDGYNRMGDARPDKVEDFEEDEWVVPPDYDPVNPVWDKFPTIEEQYATSIRNLTVSAKLNAPPTGSNASAEQYAPYPDYESIAYKAKYAGSRVACLGPRGFLLNESADDAVFAYNGAPRGFPESALGSPSVIGLDSNVCLDRYNRYGAYGLGAGAQRPIEGWSKPKRINWNHVDWAELQNHCVHLNRHRFDFSTRLLPGEEGYGERSNSSNESSPIKKQRTAVLLRTYDGFRYTSNTIRTIRAIISELSLGSGGEYEVFLLTQVKDNQIPIFTEPEAYEQVLQQSIPQEFWNMTILWNEDLWAEVYPNIPPDLRWIHVSQWLPVQWFSLSHPNFDYYWNWEMDVRFTGHHYQLTEQLGNWAKQQPRKGMWERNSRFYIPSVHGDYPTNFTQFVQNKYASDSLVDGKLGIDDTLADSSIWGPNPPSGQPLSPYDIHPPSNAPTAGYENFTWGVGEEADLITLLPMFNPEPTHYALKYSYWNYPEELKPEGPPRRATIITFYRVSHRLLSMMHRENTGELGHHMGSEVWPQSTALHHGFKAVYAPHPMYMDRHWPAKALDYIFNNGDADDVLGRYKYLAREGEGSGGTESVFGLGREHNFLPSTWYYRTELAERLYRRFLGWEIFGIGGKRWEKTHGRYCLPPMLLHPIKDMEEPEDEKGSIVH